MPSDRSNDFETEALTCLRQLTANQSSFFRAEQLEAIKELVVARNRVLLVQRTGWGKSAVYFIATRLLRDQGTGPTLLVSPLLALMRNQIEAAERMGVRAATIDSSNREEWERVFAELETGLAVARSPRVPPRGTGRVLALWGDGGWGALVQQDKANRSSRG